MNDYHLYTPLTHAILFIVRWYSIAVETIVYLAMATWKLIATPAVLLWHGAADMCLISYRKIRDLKPVYRNSYETNGLSLPVNSLRA